MKHKPEFPSCLSSMIVNNSVFFRLHLLPLWKLNQEKKNESDYCVIFLFPSWVRTQQGFVLIYFSISKGTCQGSNSWVKGVRWLLDFLDKIRFHVPQDFHVLSRLSLSRPFTDCRHHTSWGYNRQSLLVRWWLHWTGMDFLCRSVFIRVCLVERPRIRSC